MKIESEQLDWAFIQKSQSGYGPIAEQVDFFTFIESANERFNRLIERFAEQPKIIPALVGRPRVALLNQLGRSLYAITSLAKGDSDEFPRTKHAANCIVANFVSNIQVACERLSRDWKDIVNLFFKPDGVKIIELARIRATGSDSHKGGKQVLIFEFAAEPRPMRLVYKPADIEADARIIGKTRNIGTERLQLGALESYGDVDSLLRPSFAERIADWLGIDDAIPVYRFLPRLFGSTLGDTNALPIRKSYGYIEFLSHVPACDDDGKITEDFDANTSDWILTTDPQRARYYRESGRIMAMATVLGLTDLHAGNVIVHDRRPHLIDLEFVCATEKVGLEMTGLLVPGQSEVAGIGGHQEFELDMGGANPVFSRSYVSTSNKGSPDKLDHSDACSLAMSTGFAEAMVCLGAHMDEIIAFIKDELGGCVGRVNVFTTQELNNAFRQAYGRSLDRPMPDWLAHVDNDRQSQICTAPGSLEGSVKWFASTPQSFQRDIHGLDMPAFYRRLSSYLLLDSEGTPVARNSKLWKAKRSAVECMVGSLKSIKPGWQLVGTSTEMLDALICSGLNVIRSECKDKNKRALSVGANFVTKDDNWVVN